MPREKVTPEEKAMAAKDCAEGRISQTEAARRLGVDESTVSEWVQRYKANGASAFRIREHNAVYSEELKRNTVFLLKSRLVCYNTNGDEHEEI